MSFFSKIQKYELNFPNIVSWLSLKTLYLWGNLWGSLRLRIKARILGVRLGKNVSAHGKVCLLRWPGGKIAIGDNVSLISSARRATASSLAFPVRLRVFGSGASIDIGAGSQLSGTSITARSCRISIGKQVMIGPNCIMTDSDFHSHWPCEQRQTSPGYELDAPVEIDDHVWIGMNVIILKGVHIGKGAIIGAGSVVTKNISANCVACGNPCRVIKNFNN